MEERHFLGTRQVGSQFDPDRTADDVLALAFALITGRHVVPSDTEQNRPETEVSVYKEVMQ